MILDILEDEGEQQSDVLDARVAAETGLTAKTVQNIRVALTNEGLVKSKPVRDGDKIAEWRVYRTAAPR